MGGAHLAVARDISAQTKIIDATVVLVELLVAATLQAILAEETSSWTG
jgi:hypothetical protein